MPTQREVCVTGYGVVSPLGSDWAAFDAALFSGRSAIGACALTLPGGDSARLPVARCDVDDKAVVAPSRLPLDRGSAMALAAAEIAAKAAVWTAGDIDAERVGIFWGSGMGGAASFDANCRALYADDRRLRPTSVITGMPNAPLAELSLRFGARGMAMGYALACASSAVAVGEALRAVREGRIDVAIAGGSEALLSTGVLAAWHAMRVLAPLAADPRPGDAWVCRPFAAKRNGFALGEGAAALVIEAVPHARARRVRWSTLLRGYANSCDASHMTQPDASGQARTLRAALHDARLEPADIGHVNAHGTATLAGDAAEAASLRNVFGPHPPALTATKAILGHLLGAGGAVELVAMLRTLEQRRLPPTGSVEQADPALEIDLVCGGARPAPALRHALSNSFAFGGTNAVLIASRAH